MRKPPKAFRRILFRMLPLLIAGSSAAQQASAPAAQQPPVELMQNAAASFIAGDWQASYDAYSAITAKYPASALPRFRVGVSLIGLGRGAEAEKHLREGEKLGAPASQAAWRLAEALAEQGRADEAVAELRRALHAGMTLTASALDSDAHLAKLAAHPGWAALVDSFDTVAQPCRHDPRCREFDFWIGDWDVRTTGAPAIGPAARNTITLGENGCVVMEHWVGGGGSTGQSFNLFDASIGKWRQTWVDNSGGQHDYVGGLKDGNMVFEGTTPVPGRRLGHIPTRLTFFHIGADSVRQFSQTSPDSGRTWQTSYDFMYVRRGP